MHKHNLKILEYRHHHISITSTNLSKTIRFYKNFNFKEVYRYSDTDLIIIHLIGLGGMIEVFYYKRRERKVVENKKPLNDNGGFNHFSLQVSDIKESYDSIKGVEKTAITKGRTGVFYFFIFDCDGYPIEIVQDDRFFKEVMFEQE